MIKLNLKKIIIISFNYDDLQINSILISLINNICFLFEDEEFNILKLIDQEINQIIIRIFWKILQQKQYTLLLETIDLLNSFISNGFIQFFNENLIKTIKLALNLNYDNDLLIVKLLKIIHQISKSSRPRRRN